MHKMMIASVAAGLLLTGKALPAAPAADSFAGSPFENADANKDGKVSRAEFVKARAARFDRFDKNHNGVIDDKDFPKAASHPGALAKIDEQIALADANHDGSISRAELDKAATPLFDRVDSNHDGVVSSAEADKARQAALARHRP